MSCVIKVRLTELLSRQNEAKWRDLRFNALRQHVPNEFCTD